MTGVIPDERGATYRRSVNLLDALQTEHALIERVAASLRGFADVAEGTAAEARAYVSFFQRFAGDWHHEREEEVLIPALTGALELPADKGPIAVLLEDHARMALLLGQMLSSAESEELFDRAAYRVAARAYTEALLIHIDVENSVFFPECERRLAGGGIELSSREASPEELAAAEEGERLLLRYPPIETPDLVRGEGCVVCPQFYVTCSGIEREWWNEWEWEEFAEHVAAS